MTRILEHYYYIRYKLFNYSPRNIVKWLLWIYRGKPMVSYTGFNCGLCGAWENKPFSIRNYESMGEWFDTWGTCDNCIKEYTDTV